ncbi:MAG: hypothetical protein ACKESB_01290 [Candidatus Hodgkinia cicadicola]
MGECEGCASVECKRGILKICAAFAHLESGRVRVHMLAKPNWVSCKTFSK